MANNMVYFFFFFIISSNIIEIIHLPSSRRRSYLSRLFISSINNHDTTQHTYTPQSHSSVHPRLQCVCTGHCCTSSELRAASDCDLYGVLWRVLRNWSFASGPQSTRFALMSLHSPHIHPIPTPQCIPPVCMRHWPLHLDE